jgi:hypothetical protein
MQWIRHGTVVLMVALWMGASQCNLMAQIGVASPQSRQHADEPSQQNQDSAPSEKEYLRHAFLSHDFQALRTKLDHGLGLKEPEKTQLKLHLALYEGDWDLARKLYERFEIQHVARARSTFQPAMNAMEAMHFKKPAVAGLLSVVPGLGLVYSGNYLGGFLTSAAMGTIAMAGIYSMQQDSRNKTAHMVVGGLGLGLYTFNFVWAIRSARRYNERLRQNFLEGMDQLTLRRF